MSNYNALEVRDCYDRTAQEYAAQFLHELDHKPFDRNLLDRFSAWLPVGRLYDFGCGSAQTTHYLHTHQRQAVIGLDFAENALRLAQQHFRPIPFVVTDMLHPALAAGSAAGIVAFYAIVHFTYAEVAQVLQAWARLLQPGGGCLLSFHVGETSLTATDFLGVKGAQATWHFLDPNRVLTLAEQAGFGRVEALVRYPYKDHEHPSQRAYLWLQKLSTPN